MEEEIREHKGHKEEEWSRVRQKTGLNNLIGCEIWYPLLIQISADLFITEHIILLKESRICPINESRGFFCLHKEMASYIIIYS